LAIIPAANVGRARRSTEAWCASDGCAVYRINGSIALLLSAVTLSAETLKCVLGLDPASVVIYVVFLFFDAVLARAVCLARHGSSATRALGDKRAFIQHISFSVAVATFCGFIVFFYLKEF